MIALLLVFAVADWVALMPQAAAHVPRVEIQKGGEKSLCSAVVFDIDKDGFASALTAAHCVEHQPNEKIDITVNGRNAVALHSNALLDLAIVRFRAKHETAIQVAQDEPKAGTEVAILGYAFGVEEIAAQFGHISQAVNRESKTTWVNVDLIFGDSGGALIDSEDRLVGINSRIYTGGMLGQSSHMGAVVTVTQIRDYLDAYADMKKHAKP